MINIYFKICVRIFNNKKDLRYIIIILAINFFILIQISPYRARVDRLVTQNHTPNTSPSTGNNIHSRGKRKVQVLHTLRKELSRCLKSKYCVKVQRVHERAETAEEEVEPAAKIHCDDHVHVEVEPAAAIHLARNPLYCSKTFPASGITSRRPRPRTAPPTPPGRGTWPRPGGWCRPPRPPP